MVVIPSSAVGTASAVLTLSQAAWKLGSSLSKLDQEAKAVDGVMQNLAESVKTLGHECDLLYAELDEAIKKSEMRSLLPDDVNGRMWQCLGTTVEETTRTMQELQLLVKNVRGGEEDSMGQSPRQWKLHQTKPYIARIKAQICGHSDNLHLIRLLINM
jgi:hypothetical protein